MIVDPSPAITLLTGPVLARIDTNRYKAIFAFGVCAAVALLMTAHTNGWVVSKHRTVGQRLQLVALNIEATLIAAWTFYARLFQPTGIAPVFEETGPQLGALVEKCPLSDAPPTLWQKSTAALTTAGRLPPSLPGPGPAGPRQPGLSASARASAWGAASAST